MIRDKKGNLIIDGAHPPTVTGLALWLGFKSRQSFLNYNSGKQDIDDLITMAKSKCEEFAERHLYDHSCSSGAKFSLENNFNGWGKNQKDDPTNVKKELPQLYKALSENGNSLKAEKDPKNN